MKKMLSLVVTALLCSVPKFAHATYDGTPSTGSFTIVTVSALAATTSTGSVTVVDKTGSVASILSIGTALLREGRDWLVGASTSTAATSLKNAINASGIPVTATYTAGMTAITLAANDTGSAYNAVGLHSSTPTALSVSGASLTGGQDNAIVYINAIPLVQGRDWFVQDVASNTAVNLAAAINHNETTSEIVSAAWLGGASATVYLRSVLSPVAYTLSDSVGGAITESGSAMTGGGVGNITPSFCFLGSVNALPSANYPAGCLLYLNSDPTKLYISTKAVTGAEAASAYWLAK